MTRRRLCALLAGVLLAGAAHVPLSAQISQNVIEIKQSQFVPSEIAIRSGQSVTWQMAPAETTHTVTSNDGAWPSQTLNRGESFTWVFQNRGVFRFHCQLHPHMKGAVYVDTA
ncbi:MAG TPA: cupredoxin domain-containing protein, partial [Actinomycetota bacterium]|nr:cupredoxin domain-containing protein [Actinomycetota bacterium]